MQCWDTANGPGVAQALINMSRIIRSIYLLASVGVPTSTTRDMVQLSYKSNDLGATVEKLGWPVEFGRLLVGFAENYGLLNSSRRVVQGLQRLDNYNKSVLGYNADYMHRITTTR